mmetsp:Transcript_18644/g.62480  ORF Transcript_18644/g.62480 Transcript_18644/m.62480 type:complete len:203 (-) Transcript_18644:1255-1863(-)
MPRRRSSHCWIRHTHVLLQVGRAPVWDAVHVADLLLRLGTELAVEDDEVARGEAEVELRLLGALHELVEVLEVLHLLPVARLQHAAHVLVPYVHLGLEHHEQDHDLLPGKLRGPEREVDLLARDEALVRVDEWDEDEAPDEHVGGLLDGLPRGQHEGQLGLGLDRHLHPLALPQEGVADVLVLRGAVHEVGEGDPNGVLAVR